MQTTNERLLILDLLEVLDMDLPRFFNDSLFILGMDPSLVRQYQEVYIQVLYRQVQTGKSWLTKWISELQNEVRA